MCTELLFTQTIQIRFLSALLVLLGETTEDVVSIKLLIGGETGNKILYVDQMTGVGDMVMDPSNPDKILVNMWQHRREPWFFTSGGPSSGLYITCKWWENWTKQSAKDNGLPEGDLGRMGLAFATNNPNRVYAIIEAKENALYRSDNGGENWTMINDKSDIGNRPFYYFDIYVDPKNENQSLQHFHKCECE